MIISTIKEGIKVVTGFVLMQVSPLKESEILKKLLKIKEITELVPLFGEYDLIAKIEAVDYEHLGEIVIQKIRTIDGITHTKTLTKIKLHQTGD